MQRFLTLVLPLFLLGLLLFLIACNNSQADQTNETTIDGKTPVLEKPQVPEWHKNATIYEVNLRQFTPEGTFKAFEAHVPRLKDLGIDILWLMPIHPISKERRKGELGSPYAVADYYAVNPDFGSMDDFKQLLKAIHDAGMYCIIDWVPNHSGWDNPWITEHPDWYSQDAEGNIIDPIDPNTGKPWGWTDVADFNYDKPDMRLGMIEAMKFWVADIGIDGFRVDVAHSVPVDFWAQCTDTLYAVKPLFMLAEAEVPPLRNNGSFAMDYSWEMHHLLNEIAKSQGANRDEGTKLVQGNVVESAEEEEEKKTALHIDSLLMKKARQYTQGYQMQFTSNHDENSWAGTEFQRMGEGHKAFAVLTATFDGMPLIYTGQESAMDKQLEFFTKDEVPWGDYSYTDFYQKLFALKHRNKALWNGIHGGPLVKITTGNDENVYAFTREKDEDKVVVIINLSGEKQAVELQGSDFPGDYKNVFDEGKTMSLSEGITLEMDPWEYWVLSSN